MPRLPRRQVDVGHAAERRDARACSSSARSSRARSTAASSGAPTATPTSSTSRTRRSRSRRSASSRSPTTRRASAVTSPTTARRSTACTTRPSRAATGWRRRAWTATARTTSRGRTSRARASRRRARRATRACRPPTRRACTAARSSRRRTRDVPTCTDCHQSHAIAGPHAPGWRLKSPELCASCHANAGMMKKYGLSTNVMQTYLADFHGMTASLQKQEKAGGADGGQVVALCIDCHGVHDITKTDAARTRRVIKANVTKTCQKCHPGASQNFSAAWLSHYEPTFKNAPLVYSVKIALLHPDPVHDRRPRPPDPAAPVAGGGQPMKNYVIRFTPKQRIEHASVMTLFFVLAVTGPAPEVLRGVVGAGDHPRRSAASSACAGSTAPPASCSRSSRSRTSASSLRSS